MPEEIVTLQSRADWACEKVDIARRQVPHSTELLIRLLSNKVDCRITFRILSPFHQRQCASVQTIYEHYIHQY